MIVRQGIAFAGLLTCLFLMAFKEKPQKQDRPNILFIAIDDLNDWITVFNESNPVKTPNIDKLAKKGAFFSRAYSASPACNPSRASIMLGKRPHRTGIYGNKSDWRGALPEAKTLQRYFKENGYFVAGAGKIFHHHLDWAFHDNASFNEYLMMTVNEPYPDNKLNGLEWYGSRNTDWGVWPKNIEETADYRTANYAVQFLKRKHDKPFMLNVGIYKPHSPFFAPEEFFDLYPLSTLTMPEINGNDADDLPAGAVTLTQSTDWFWDGMVKAKKEDSLVHQNFVQAYQACATFADAMIGKILNALDKSPYKDNTIIVLWSDHGFHLGEKEHIEKFALWEKTTHVPYIIVAPGITQPGMVIDKPVDLTTLFPTLVDLAGLPMPKGIDGFSLVPLLIDPSIPIPPALMTYMKGNHAIRTEKWRYIQYADGTEELYNHEKDKKEWNNLADLQEYQPVINELRKYIPQENADQVKDLQK